MRDKSDNFVSCGSSAQEKTNVCDDSEAMHPAGSNAADDGQHWKRQPSASFNGLRTSRRLMSAANCKCQGRLISSLQAAAEQKAAGA